MHSPSDPPRIEPSTKLIRRVGECLELECKTAGDPQPRVKWFLNDTLLQVGYKATMDAFHVESYRKS